MSQQFVTLYPIAIGNLKEPSGKHFSFVLENVIIYCRRGDIYVKEKTESYYCFSHISELLEKS